MNKKILGTITGFVFISCFLLSCSQEDSVNENEQQGAGLIDIADFNKFMNQQTDGSFSLTHTTTGPAQEKLGHADVSGTFNQDPDQMRSSSGDNQGGTATIGGIDVFAQTTTRAVAPGALQLQADNLFGTKVEFVIRPANPVKPVVIDTMYVPQKVRFTMKYLAEQTPSVQYYSPGNVITWVADPQNTKGVVVIVKYSPVANSQKHRAIRNSEVLHIKNVADNGSFTLSSDMFTDIPKTALITVSVARGNYQYSGTVDIYSIYAYSIVNLGGYYQ
jgi:hypothetical protein